MESLFCCPLCSAGLERGDHQYRCPAGHSFDIAAAETGAACSTLSMAMSGDDYFSAMYANIDALKEALK